MKSINKTLALIALASSSAAFAASDFDTLDVDGNGVISQSEASVDAKLMSMLSELDTDQNGELSKQEFSKHNPKLLKFWELKLPHYLNDLRNTHYENITQNICTYRSCFFVSSFAASDFDTLDTDGNGAISQSEASVDAKLMSMFSELDTDQNGELSKEEFSKA